MGLLDGLSSLEVRATIISGATIQGTLISGTTVAATNVSGASIVAGAGTIGTAELADSAVSGAKIADAGIGNAKLDTVAASGTKVDYGVPIAYLGSIARAGLLIQAGSVATGAGSGGTIVFAKQFISNDYLVLLSPDNFVAGAGSVVPYASGTKNRSGCEMVGAASTVYQYAAVGSGRV